ncbi:MAG: hypothetical protein H6557_08130 [Lewinellaceae bacterium]|nr:hypothetical protein [Lewinellaceae bacterium]
MINHKLKQIIERIEFIEAFSSELNSENQIMVKMAFRAIEREVEVIALLWDSIIATNEEIDSINIENVLSLDRRINSTYVEAQKTLIISIVKGTLPKLKLELEELLASRQSSNLH